MNTLIYPFINPLPVFDKNPVLDDRYRSRDFIDFGLEDTLLPWQQRVSFCQPWQKSDTIFIQLQTDIGPVNFILIDCKTELVVDTVGFVQKEPSLNQPGLFIYELTAPLNIYEPGCYKYEYRFGVDPVIFTMEGGEIDIQDEHENSTLVQYKHYEFREGIVFETGVLFQMRVFSTNRYQKTASKSTTYEDQTLNLTPLRSTTFRLWKWVIGQSKGIPDWMADKIGRIIGCSTLMLDEKSFTKISDSEMEPIEDDYYPLRGWSVDLRERYNRNSRTFEDNTPLNARVTVIINVDSKGFGDSNAGNETVTTDVQ